MASGSAFVFEQSLGGIKLVDFAQPLEEIELVGVYMRCLELVVSATASAERLVLRFAHAQPLVGPLPREKRKKVDDDATADSDSSQSDPEVTHAMAAGA